MIDFGALNPKPSIKSLGGSNSATREQRLSMCPAVLVATMAVARKPFRV